MAHEVMQGPHPFLKIIRLYGDVEHEDLTCADEVGLNEGHPIYLLTNAAKINVGLPEKFLDTIRHSMLSNPNLAHDAVFMPDSPAMSTVAQMAIKLTRSQKKVSLHRKYEEAQDHLLRLIKEAGL